MSVAEMKKLIHEKVEQLNSEEALNEVLRYVEKLDEKEFKIEEFFNKSKQQYGEALAKLAK